MCQNRVKFAAVGLCAFLVLITHQIPSNYYFNTDFYIDFNDDFNADSDAGFNATDGDGGTRVWISMAVCFSENTHYFGKTRFPYKTAAILSSNLWRQKTNHKVLMQVIYDPHDQNNIDLVAYLDTLTKTGATVKLVKNSDRISCSLAAQLQRFLLVDTPDIRSDDIVVISDVDAFVIRSDIFSNLVEPYKIWIYQYEHMVQFKETFPACFVGMTKNLWIELTGGAKDGPGLIDRHDPYLNLWANLQDSWGFDQLILTRFILKSGLCTVDSSLPIWSDVNETAPSRPIKDDSSTCFHGSDWSNCWSGKPKQPYPCKWWHFAPSTTKRYLIKKYKQYRIL